MSHLNSRGIPSRVYFPPIHLQPFYREGFGYVEGDFPITERISTESLALPFSSTMAQEEVEYVCEHLKVALSQSLRS